MKLIILFALFVQIFGQNKIRYDHYQVWRVLPKTEANIEFLQKLEQSCKLRFWTEIKGSNQFVDIMVPPYQIEEFKEIIHEQRMDLTLFVPNVQSLIDNERGNFASDKDFGWTDYHTLDEIYGWMSSLVDKYPDKVSIEKGGTTYEGRDILGIHLTLAPGNENRSVFVESNIHANEWIGSAVSTYILNEILTSEDPRVRQVADTHDWYFFPVINPDGFVYTHTTDRTWRKTRVPYNNSCFGADPNRNWDYHYNEGGSSDDPCSGNYRGPHAFSEPSMKSLSEYIKTIGYSLEAYISFHSYSQVMLIPYGYTSEHLDNYDELYAIGLKAIDALTSHYGTEFDIGDVAEIMYIASGGSFDWVKGTFGTPITYTYELRDKGQFGFILPADQIIPSGIEMLDSIITIFEEYDQRICKKKQ